MVKMEQMSDGYYVLKVTYGCVTIVKVFMDADIPLEKVSTEPKPDGFYLDIPDEK